MKNKYIIFLFVFFFSKVSLAENLNIEAKNIILDKNKELTVFEEEVKIKTEDKSTIKSDYAEYNKKKGFIILKDNIVYKDIKNNLIKTNYAEYDENKKFFKSLGKTEIITNKRYKITSENIFIDKINNIIKSNDKSIVTDLQKNKISLDNFEYIINENIFKSVGLIKIKDSRKNSYEFSQIYIDTNKKEILGTDSKAFLNDENFKIDKNNKPRVFSNSVNIKKESSLFNKSIFTLCNYRKNDKCPPWSIQASKMLHDNKKKTIYYDNALIKVYDIPIFYLPKLSHPDPTVERRSGFLPPAFSDSKNLGFGTSIPYFFALGNDKNFTLNTNFYASENPLIMGEYHQAFRNSNLLADFGYTEGYKKTNNKKKSGEKSHFFAKFTKNFKGEKLSNNSMSISLQDVSNDKYLKLYKIRSNLVDYNTDTLESSFNFTHDSNKLFLGLNASIFETLKESYEDKYEYIVPEITVDKNLISSEKIGSIDLQSNLKVHNYDTNKLTNFFVNDFNYVSKNLFSDFGLKSNFLGNLKNINYEAKNVDIYKKDTTSEIYGALGLLSEFNLQKFNSNTKHLLKPKILLRYSPGSMRKENSGSRLNPDNAFSLNRLENKNNYETGFSGTLGFDYNFKNNLQDFDFSVAQIINDRENKKMSSKSSLDEKVSDMVGTMRYKVGKNLKLKYNFALDQNYSDLNFNEFETTLNYGSMNIDFNYLQEKKHIGDQDYFKTKINIENNKNGLFSFETKRNLVTNSSEFYNLSYEYINDCLRAGLVYRREFYDDSELEQENSLMFKITLTPFGSINSPSFSR